MAKSYPIVHIIDPRDRRDVLLSVAMIAPEVVDAFVDEIARELGALLGVNREAARTLIEIDQRGSVVLPVPSAFDLSDHSRRLLAVDVAKALRFALGAQAVAA